MGVSLRELAFMAAKQREVDVDAAVDRASDALDVFPKGAMGLTPDAVKFRVAKAVFAAAFAEQRRFNAWFLKTFSAEIKAERAQRREVAAMRRQS